MPSTLAQRLMLARKHAGLSQARLAALIGVSRPAVSQWESSSPNATQPTNENLRLVSTATAAPLTWLLSDDSDLVATWIPAAVPVDRPQREFERAQRVMEQRRAYALGERPQSPAPPASQLAQLDDDKLERSIQFLERQFALLERDFVASRNADLIAGVYARIGRRGESNLIALSQWLNQQLENEGRINDGQGGIRGAG